RGIIYFAIKGATFLPLLKHGMDYYYAFAVPCGHTIFPLVCTDDWGSTWTIFSEVGAESVAALLALIVLGLHSVVALAFLVMAALAPPKDGFMYLVALEDGCCGAAAVVMSLGAFDVEVEVQRKGSSKWRRLVRVATAALQVAIIVALSSAISIVTKSDTPYPQKTSLFVLLPA
ncbi:hypothetical protein HK405_000959, partial [Cladochytrium tenue]